MEIWMAKDEKRKKKKCFILTYPSWPWPGAGAAACAA